MAGEDLVYDPQLGEWVRPDQLYGSTRPTSWGRINRNSYSTPSANDIEWQRLNKEVERLKAKPTLGDYEGIGTDSKYKFDPKLITGEEISQEAMSSPWYKMALQKQELDQKNALQRNALQGAGTLADARSQLAMRGGLRSGAWERLANSGMQNTMLGQQNIRSAGMGDRANLGMKSADIASALLTQNANTINTGRLADIKTNLWDLEAKQDWKKKVFDEDMKNYASQQSI